MSGVIAAGREPEVPQVHPSGKNILGEGNLAFMHGPPHKAIRKSFLSLFTRKALSMYVELQDGIIRRQIHGWLDRPGEREIRTDIRCGQKVGICRLRYATQTGEIQHGEAVETAKTVATVASHRLGSACGTHTLQARVVVSVPLTGSTKTSAEFCLLEAT